ncbi:MAG: hypothetical protein EOO96_27950, partial [Pedobacter sp.]
MKNKGLHLLVFMLLASFGYIHAQNSTNNITLSDKERAKLDAKALNIPAGYLKNLKWNLILDSIGKNASTIKWKSDKVNYLTDDGKLLKKSTYHTSKVKVKMTATIASGKESVKKSFNISIAYEERQMQGYLFTYFEG